jgi:Secretion system C-terminal sorting domain
MKKITLTILGLMFELILVAQPTIQWQKTYGGSYFDQAFSIEQTSDEGYIVAGNTGSTDGNVLGNHGGYDFWVLKLANEGTIQWKKALGGSNNDWPYCIQQTIDGGYIVVGSTQSNDGDVSGYHGGIDGWVVKLSATGSLEWQKTLGGSGWDGLWSVRQTSDHGYIVVGKSNSLDGDVSGNHGELDCWVAKLNSTGMIIWQKSFGGSNWDLAYAVKQTTDGGYIIASETASYDGDILEQHGNIDYWLIKLTSEGDIAWQKTYGGLQADIPGDVEQTIDGGYIVTGISGSHNSGDVTGHHGLFDYWVVKVSALGEIEWQKALGGTGLDYGESIIQSANGEYVVFGSTDSVDGDLTDTNGGTDYWLLGLSALGNIVWQKRLGGTKADEGYAVRQTNDNGFILAGAAWSTDGDVSGVKGYNDFWIVKLSPENTSATQSPQALLSIAPNPASTAITLQIPSADHILQISISDLLGRTLSRQTIANGGQADVSSLPSGLYLVSAATESGQLYVGKLLKG